MSAAQPAPIVRPDTKIILFPASPRPHDWLSLWHLLSLDAPTVATLWMIFLACETHAKLGWKLPAAMFLCVWMLYVADRLLDARLLDARLPEAQARDTPGELRDLEARHIFHHRHRRIFVPMLFVAAALLAALLPQLEPAALRLYAALAALLAAYFFLIHIYFRPTARLPKEFAVGVFFAAAVFLPAIEHAPALPLLPCAFAFAAVCTLNCLYLYTWEHPGPRMSAHITTRFATAQLPSITAVVLCMEAALAYTDASVRPIASALLLSTFLLAALHSCRKRLLPLHLRASADLALLTPLLFLPLLLLHRSR